VENPSERKALGLSDPDHGVLVTDVHEKGSSYGHLEKGDILLSIDGHPIASNGRVDLEGDSVDLNEIVERKFSGDQVTFSILRSGKSLQITFPLRGTWPFHMQANAYDEKPRYLLHGGLLFQPLDRNFMTTVGQGDLRLHHAFEAFVEEHLYLERPEIVVLSRVLADPVNKECDGLHPGIVDTINGKKIRALANVAEAFATPAKYDVITLLGSGLPIVLKRSEEQGAEKRIMENYGIASPSNL
jgi:hypothetical protein